MSLIHRRAFSSNNSFLFQVSRSSQNWYCRSKRRSVQGAMFMTGPQSPERLHRLRTATQLVDANLGLSILCVPICALPNPLGEAKLLPWLCHFRLAAPEHWQAFSPGPWEECSVVVRSTGFRTIQVQAHMLAPWWQMPSLL